MDVSQGTGSQQRNRTTSPGAISLCPHKGCNFCCTEFTSGNYIVLYPGEIAGAAQRGVSVSHLRIVDANDHGGARAVCEAKDRKTCDNGYKPLDCASYPYFPDLVDPNEPVTRLLKGTKCPLTPSEIREHERWVKNAWTVLAAENAAVGPWLQKSRLVGYEPAPVEPETLQSGDQGSASVLSSPLEPTAPESRFGQEG